VADLEGVNGPISRGVRTRVKSEDFFRDQWRRSKGASAPGRRPWGRTNTLFAVILKRILSRN